MTDTTTPPETKGRRRPATLRRILCALPLVAVAGWAVVHRRVLLDGGRLILDAEPGWLLAAVATTGLAWVAAACARQGAVLERLPAGRLLAAQFAASSANHVLPAGLGAGAVNLRMLTVCGVPLARSSAALGLYLLAESVGRVVLLLTLLAAFPRALRLAGLFPAGAGLPLATAAGVVVTVAALVLTLVRPVRRTVAAFLRTALTDARTLHTRPSRILGLWGGSLAFPALQAAGLVAVTRALDVPVPVIHVAIAYLAASVAAAAVPTPGGIGSVDAALVVALVTTGAPIAVATAAVLAYRIITVWLPLIPGALVLSALVRRRVV